MIPRVPEAKWDSDPRRPPMFRPIGPEVEIARSADWSIMVSRSHDGGFCISDARAGGGSGISAERLVHGSLAGGNTYTVQCGECFSRTDPPGDCQRACANDVICSWACIMAYWR
jgi:hypothetical protein